MTRIEDIFRQQRAVGGKALMPFVTAGDPDLATTAALLPALQDAGAAVCEIGFPFSDPIADGPVIQASMARALERGVTSAAIFDMVARLRPSLHIGLVAMASYSIIYRRGLAEFLEQAQRSGFDGLIVPDVVIEESAPLRDAARRIGLTCSFLIAPSTPIERAQRIAEASSGFIYLLARAGLTGEQRELAGDLPQRIERIRQVTDLPIAVGFGISTRKQVEQVVTMADAAIVGSAIVKRLAAATGRTPAAAADATADSGASPASTTANLVADIRAFVSDLAAGLPTARQGQDVHEQSAPTSR